jgi:two-component system cell cycle sensor histidine kinase/response regulator CckA
MASVMVGGLAITTLLSARSAEWLVLASLAMLAMAGTFFLFGLAAGHIRFAHSPDAHAVLRAAAGQLDEGLQITTRDGSTIYANAQFDAILGNDAQDKPRAPEELLAGEPVAAECLFRLTRAADRGETHEEEFRLRTGDARSRAARWVRLGVRPFTASGAPGQSLPLTLWQARDITNERAREAETVRDLETALAYYESLPVGLLAAELNGAVTHINGTLESWLGLASGAARPANLSLSDIFAGPEEALLRARAVQAEGSATKLELDLVGRDGVSIPVVVIAQVREAGAERARLTVLVLNPETDVRGEDQSGAPEANFARFFHSAPFGIATFGRDGHLLSANGAFARMFFDDGKANLRSVADLLSTEGDPEARRLVENALSQIAAGRAAIEPIEISIGPDRQYTRRVYMAPVAKGGRKGEAGVLYAIDATEQKALELKYAQSQKMEAVGQLAGGIAHDFNNVLTAIIGFSDLLLQTHRPTDPAYKDIMNIKQSADRAAGLVRQLLAFSRRQTLQPEVLELGEVLTDNSAWLNRLLGEKIELRILSGRDLWHVKADKTQLDQVIINLAVNARDAMPDGGRLTVRTRNIVEREALKLRAHGVAPAEYVLIEVEDTGHGMAPEVMAKIFEPFFSTKEIGKGTGLGLSTVYGIIKQTGGYVLPESEIGRGTVFSIYLPRHIVEREDEIVPRRDKKRESARDLTGTGRVLLVEDEDSVRNFAARALKRQGYEVLEASTGVEALDVVAREQGRIDIVVSDVVMPEMDGPTMLKELRVRSPDLKVIFVSGYPDDAFKKSLDADEQFAFLPKPFTLPQLAAKVKEELAR